MFCAFAYWWRCIIDTTVSNTFMFGAFGSLKFKCKSCMPQSTRQSRLSLCNMICMPCETRNLFYFVSLLLFFSFLVWCLAVSRLRVFLFFGTIKCMSSKFILLCVDSSIGVYAFVSFSPYFLFNSWLRFSSLASRKIVHAFMRSRMYDFRVNCQLRVSNKNTKFSFLSVQLSQFYFTTM